MTTTVKVSDDTHERLRKLKPYPSVSFDDLINEMADAWEMRFAGGNGGEAIEEATELAVVDE